MKVVSSLAVAALLLGFTPEALGVKLYHEVTKSSPELSIQAEKRNDGTVAFTLVRDPKASRYHGKFYGRGAELRVSSPKGLVAKCTVEGTSEKNGIEYHFVLAADFVEHSELVLSEIDQTGIDGRKDVMLLGGGDLFHIKLKHFVPGPKPAGPESK